MPSALQRSRTRPSTRQHTQQQHPHRIRFTSFLLLLLLAFPCTLLSALSTTHRPDVAVPSRALEARGDGNSASVLIQHAPARMPDGTLLVSTLDGTLHALDLRSGEHLWSFGAGSSMVSSFDASDATQRGAATSSKVTSVFEQAALAEAHEAARLEREERVAREARAAVDDAEHLPDDDEDDASVRRILSQHEQLQRELHRDLASHDLIFDQDDEDHAGHPQGHPGNPNHKHRGQTLEEQEDAAFASGARSNAKGAGSSGAPASNSSTAPLMIPGVDGSLFYSGSHGLQRLPINVAELVEAAPFRTGDNTRYLGFKEVNVFLIHRNSGALKRVFSPRHTQKFSLYEACENDECDPNLIWVAKTDLTVHAIDGRSGKLRWNVSVSQYAPFDNTEGVVELSEAELDSLGYPAVGVSVGGTVHAIDVSNQRIHWSQALHSPVTAVFLVRPEQPSPDGSGGDDPEDADANMRLNSGGGDMVKLPHFYFNVPAEPAAAADHTAPPTPDAPSSLMTEMIASYYYSRDSSDVLTYTYIGQTASGLIYALPNPTPTANTAVKTPLFFDRIQATANSRPTKGPLAIAGSHPPVNRPSAGKVTIPAIGDTAVTTAAATTHSQSGASHVSTPAVDDSPDAHCVPTSPSYPSCLIGFHALGLSAAGASSASRLDSDHDPRLPSSVDFYNQSLRPHFPYPRAYEEKDDGTLVGDHAAMHDWSHSGGNAGNGGGNGRRPPRLPPKRPSKDSSDSNEDASDYYAYYESSFPSSFRESLIYFWPLVAFSVIISVLMSLCMLGWQRLSDERRRSWEEFGARQNWGPKQWARFRNNQNASKKAAEKAEKKRKNAAERAASGTIDDADLSDEEEKEDGGPNNAPSAPALSAAARRRQKKEALRGVFPSPSPAALAPGSLQRQASDPLPNSNNPSSSPAVAGAGAANGSSGTLVTRKSHFSTYESAAAPGSNLLAPGLTLAANNLPLASASSAASGAAAGGASGGSGESKLIRPRKHIQSKPDFFKLNSDAASSSISPTLQRTFSTVTNNPDGSVSIGSMVYFPHQVLGTGSMGTVVYAGTFEGRPCAIKRLVKPFFGSANAAQEIALLIQSDQHPNVLRYYAKDEDTSFIYLALEQCVGTIQDLVDSHSSPNAPAQHLDETVSILYGMMTGLAHLHSLHIVHRDLKPMNILLTKNGGAKLADMGLGKQLSMSRSSFDSVVSGSIGWQAPEVLNANGGRLTKAVDVFSAGCVMHFVLTKGQHPFGENVERELNIAHGRMDLSALAGLPEARDLIGCCLHPDPALRMSAEDVVAHPFFWPKSKQLAFLLEASDRFESEPEHSELRMCLEAQAAAVVGPNWNMHLNQALLDNLNKYRKYDTSSVRDCLRVIRNKKNHYRDLPLSLRTELGSVPDGFLDYFTSRFPALLIYVYSVLSCFCLESPASSLGDTYSYSPLDLDHGVPSSAANPNFDLDLHLESVSAFFHKPLSCYPELKFSSPQLQQFYSAISLRRLIQLQKHTRLRFRHWYVQEDRWMPTPAPAAAAASASASPDASPDADDAAAASSMVAASSAASSSSAAAATRGPRAPSA